MTEPNIEVLEAERRFYERERARLLASHAGKFALIHGETLLGVFDSQPSAYEEGLRRLGNVPMLIIQIVREQPVEEQSPALHLGLINARPFS